MACFAPALRSAVARQLAGRPPAFSVLACRPTAAPAAFGGARTFSAAAGKVSKVLASELKHEEEQYEQAKEIKSFLKSSAFKLVETPGDVNMALEKALGEKTVRIEWQLSSPFDPDMDAEGEEAQEAPHEATEFSVQVEDKSGAGMIFYCTTQPGEDHRYLIGNVKTYANVEQKEGVSSYHGPEFEDLDDKLQEALDEYLAEAGMGSEVCDFVDAMAGDKEQREYVHWLKATKKFLEA